MELSPVIRLQEGQYPLPISPEMGTAMEPHPEPATGKKFKNLTLERGFTRAYPYKKVIGKDCETDLCHAIGRG